MPADEINVNDSASIVNMSPNFRVRALEEALSELDELVNRLGADCLFDAMLIIISANEKRQQALLRELHIRLLSVKDAMNQKTADAFDSNKIRVSMLLTTAGAVASVASAYFGSQEGLESLQKVWEQIANVGREGAGITKPYSEHEQQDTRHSRDLTDGQVSKVHEYLRNSESNDSNLQQKLDQHLNRKGSIFRPAG